MNLMPVADRHPGVKAPINRAEGQRAGGQAKQDIDRAFARGGPFENRIIG
jgi:hypothetical protein